MSPMVRRQLTIELGLLGFLQQGPLHGYQVYQQISSSAGLQIVWKLKQAHLYALLARLEEAGFITGSIQQQETRPARWVYHLTGTGELAFLEWLGAPVASPRLIRQEFQAKLYFARQVSPEALNILVNRQRAVCQRWLDDQLEMVAQARGTDRFTEIVCQYRIGQIRATLSWLDSIKTGKDT
jgi:PadR family transcriptional regulator, regulatory protein AphA